MVSTASLVAALAAIAPFVAAQNCISLTGSSQCPAFNRSSISTDAQLVGLFPFLNGVDSRDSFDRALSGYINTTYVQTKYQQLLGCTKVSLSNTTAYYARYTTSVICNAIIQNSVGPCGLTGAAATPLCADSCATFAINEEEIATNQQLCGTANQDYVSLIRADFTNCALPPDSLNGQCIPAEQNEPDECGFSTNLGGLCNYCAASSPNATDSCCIGSDVNQRCQGVSLPSSVTSLPPLFSSAAPTSAPPVSAGADNVNNGLSGGAIAGIVIGVIAGVGLLAALIALFIICLRRRRGSQHGSIFNQPSPRREPVIGAAPGSRSLASRDYSQPTIGGRVTRMTALSNEDEFDPGMEKGFDSGDEHFYDAAPVGTAVAAGAGLGAGAAAVRSGKRAEVGRRRASLNSVEMLGSGAVEERDSSSPQPGGLSSGETGNATSGQSEQLPYFKDYYSSDDIYPGNRVSVLWGYQPRAEDEWELERGDMLKVVGIWDDGWATGVRIDDRAEQYVARLQRDSGVSNGSDRADSPVPEGDVKAFPLVCVCLPQHWQKTIEGSDSASPPTDL